MDSWNLHYSTTFVADGCVQALVRKLVFKKVYYINELGRCLYPSYRFDQNVCSLRFETIALLMHNCKNTILLAKYFNTYTFFTNA